MVFNFNEDPLEYDSDSPPASPSSCLLYFPGCSFKKKPVTSHQAGDRASLHLTIQGSESGCSCSRPGESLQFPGSDLELFQGCLKTETVTSHQAAAGASLPPGYHLAAAGASLPPDYHLAAAGASLPPGYHLAAAGASLPPGYHQAAAEASLPPGYNQAATGASLPLTIQGSKSGCLCCRPGESL